MKDRVWRERIRSPKSVEDMKYNVPIFRQKNKKRDYLSTWLLSPVLRNFKLFHLCEVAGVWGRGLGYRVVPQGGKSGQKGCGGGRGRHSSGGASGALSQPGRASSRRLTRGWAQEPGLTAPETSLAPSPCNCLQRNLMGTFLRCISCSGLCFKVVSSYLKIAHLMGE